MLFMGDSFLFLCENVGKQLQFLRPLLKETPPQKKTLHLRTLEGVVFLKKNNFKKIEGKTRCRLCHPHPYMTPWPVRLRKKKWPVYFLWDTLYDPHKYDPGVMNKMEATISSQLPRNPKRFRRIGLFPIDGWQKTSGNGKPLWGVETGAHG